MDFVPNTILSRIVSSSVWPHLQSFTSSFNSYCYELLTRYPWSLDLSSQFLPCKDWIRFGFRHRLGTCHGCSEEHSVLHQSCSMWKTFSFLSRSIGYQHFSSFFALNGALNANFVCFLKAFHFTTRFQLRPGLRDCASILLFIFVYMPILLAVVLLSGEFQDWNMSCTSNIMPGRYCGDNSPHLNDLLRLHVLFPLNLISVGWGVGRGEVVLNGNFRYLDP